MRFAPVLALAALVIGVPAASPLRAQLSAKKLGGTYVPQRPRFAVLSVHYTLIGGTKMTLTTPSGSFTCAPPPSFPAGLPTANCTLAVSRGSSVALMANYMISGAVAATGKDKPMTGKQWQGACAGTISDTCTLAMTEDRTVEISPYAAP